MNVDILTADWSRLWLPPETLPLSEWAERNIILSPEYSARTGPLTLYGWQRGILDSFTDPTVETTVLMTGTQLIKTLYQQVATAYAIASAPAPILMVAPKEADSETFSKERLEPMLRDCPVLAGKCGNGKQKDRLNTTLFKRFPGGSLSLVGAGAPGNAARRSICYAFLDEIDKYLKDVGGEGDFIDLVRERTATYGSRRKIILACSPTRKHTSRIGRAYEQSDQRQPWVPCPHCGEHQVLKFAQVRWNNKLAIEERPATARYFCEHCEAPWNDVQRLAACEMAEWRARRPFTGTAGFWISHLYSPWKSLGDVVSKFLAAKDDRLSLKSFVNTNLAELYEEEGDTPDWEVLVGRREGYAFGSEPAVDNENAVVPRRGLFLTAFVDVQEDRLEYEVVAWGRGKESWSIAYGVIRAFGSDNKALPTSNPAVWDELEKVLRRDWKHEGGDTMPIMAMGIDTGFRPKPVYEFAMRHPQVAVGAASFTKVHSPRTVVPTKGSSTEMHRIIAGVTKEDAARRRHGVRIVSIGTATAKQELFDNLRLPRPSEGAAMPGYCHFPAYEPEYFHGLCSEKRVIHDDDSITWEKIYARNEPLDCRVGNRAMAAVFGCDRFGEAQWLQLERGLGISPPVERRQSEPEEIYIEQSPAPQPAKKKQTSRQRVIHSPYL